MHVARRPVAAAARAAGTVLSYCETHVLSPIAMGLGLPLLSNSGLRSLP